ncbi:hypothetical protein RB623_00950 [Mesorhizobium sp. LHD-90]|uniref:hypothetical protein n=1 Tax=Mesorhizobium sp. LHD-90 TaxID=3071414 RepID=UPI0027E19626|nr:hypothetical protein [Mesorhizobium sp. LHD-90]MDQ6432617.1 hypothetical protein [Mesorhizobium sp. LHD-90]
MRNHAARLTIAGALAIGALTQANAEPLKTMDEVGAALQACWTPPPGSGDSSVTLSFSFRRDGTLIGPPRPSAINVAGDEAARKQFVDAATAALEACLPLEFSPAIADGIAGTVFTMPFGSTPADPTAEPG